MAFIGTCTDKGRVKQTNEDSCCVEVADTPLGEVLMAIVCDGVGGFSHGDLASSTVVDRFSRWFESELPSLMVDMVAKGRFSMATVSAVWGVMLANLNDQIQAYGTANGCRLGTTFSGVIACDGEYLVGHVGDCRVYQMSRRTFKQVTHDQTLLAQKIANGELGPEEAREFGAKNVILQSVGTERVLKPEFATGTFGPDDLFVVCCDGAYRKVGGDGIRDVFQDLDYRSEDALQEACRSLLMESLNRGERDNLTVVCFSGCLEGPSSDAPTEVFDDETRSFDQVVPTLDMSAGPLPQDGRAVDYAGQLGDSVATTVFDDTEGGDR